MASGIFYGTTANSQITARIEWSSTPNTANNTSTVTAILSYKKESTYANATYSRTFEGSITINGNTQAIEKYNSNRIYLYSDAGWVTMGSHTVTVTHDNNGSKSITISATGAMVGTSFTSTSCSSSVTLDTIPRASSITSAGAVTLGNACSVKWTPLASSFAYKLKFVCGNVSYTTGYISPNTTSAYTYTGYTMAVSTWAAAMPKAYSGTCTVTLYTYQNTSSTSAIGSNAKTFQLTLSTSVKPTISFANPTLVNGWNGYYIQGKSQCTLSATFAAGTGSTISSCSISGTGLSKTGSGTSLSGTTSVLTQSGTFTYTATVADGRTSVSATKSIYVYPYARPVLSLSAARTSNSGEVKFTYKTSCSPVNSKNNLVTLKIYQKLATTSTWPSSATKTVTLSAESANSSITLSGYDSTSSYDFKAVVTDTYGSSSVEAIASIPSEFRILNISEDKQRLSIGKMAADNVNTRLFDCAIPARFLNGVEFANNNNPVYASLEASYSDNGHNIVYIKNGQAVDGGSTMGLAISKASVYILGESNNGLINLGDASRKWKQLYAANGTISTSDKTKKTDITDMSDTQEQLFNKLKPVTYKFINGTSDRTHYGFISQDIEDSLNELNLTGRDFAGFCKDLRIDDNGKAMLDENNNKIYDYSLRYSEFIALNTYMIQKLQAENKELKREIQVLKEMIMNSNASSNNVE